MFLKYIFITLFFVFVIQTNSQNSYPKSWFENESSTELTHGKLSQSNIAPPNDFDKLIGDCNCKSFRKLPNGKWSEPTHLLWRWKYIMNGNAIQDEGWYGNKENPYYFTSIRVYDNKNKHWYVSYFTPNQTFEPDTWIGNLENEKIILIGDITTPNGNVLSKLIFSEITDKGFEWEGRALANEEDAEGNGFWKISCKKIL